MQRSSPNYMEKIEVLQEKFKELCNQHKTSHGYDASYYEGKMVGMIEGVSMLMGISWIEADVLLRKESVDNSPI